MISHSLKPEKFLTKVQDTKFHIQLCFLSNAKYFKNWEKHYHILESLLQ